LIDAELILISSALGSVGAGCGTGFGSSGAVILYPIAKKLFTCISWT
jgi:hypothetical protein